MNPSERLLRQFRDLVTVRLERINRALMELEAGASPDAGRGALRELHGLKGEARMMGFDDINVLVHEMEELVRCVEPRRYALSADSADALLSAADAVLLLSGAQPGAASSPEVVRLVGWLQACTRAETRDGPTGEGAGESSSARVDGAESLARTVAAASGGGAPRGATGDVGGEASGPHSSSRSDDDSRSWGHAADSSSRSDGRGRSGATAADAASRNDGSGKEVAAAADAATRSDRRERSGSYASDAASRSEGDARSHAPAADAASRRDADARSLAPAFTVAPRGEAHALDGTSHGEARVSDVPSRSGGAVPDAPLWLEGGVAEGPARSGVRTAPGGNPLWRVSGTGMTRVSTVAPSEPPLRGGAPPPTGGISTVAQNRGWPSAPRPETSPARPSTGATGASPSPTPAPGPRVAAPGQGTSTSPRQPETRMDAVRIDVASLDLLTSAVTNLAQVARRRERANARRLALARELGKLAREAEDLGPAAAALVARLGTAKELAADLHRESKLLSNEELRDLGMVVEEVQGLRMLPLSVLFEPYPRMVRDLSRTLGKEVELVVDGEDTRADRAVVEALREPLMHLVRNALDHGLETRVDRVTSGKHPRGCLTLRAAREGSRIILRVEDDGMGLDPVELRRVAVRRGVLDESAANALSDAATRELIFLPGFTSREVVTDLSGRGVGLDAVRASIQGLGGDVGVESAPGWGTIFELRVPVSLTVAPLLFVQVGTETLALSATHVSRALKVEPLHLCEVAGRPALLVEGRVLPLASLGSLLGLSPEREVREGELVLVVRSQSGAAAVVVDRVLEERVQAILPLRGVLARFGHLTGATSLADGRLAMVLSAAYLTASAHGTSPLKLPRSSAPETESRRRRILVVDDSPLTRELISNLLEAVGYDTVMAADGADALDVLEGTPVDLVVTDLEMPGMDGLALTRRLKELSARPRLPVVILTTRGGEEDRRRGLAAGADAYVTKGDLVRQDLVDVVGRLLS